MLAVVSAPSVALQRRGKLGETEIENLGVASLRHEDVRRLDVPVKDAFAVSCIQSIGDLYRERQRPLGVKRSSRDQRF